jgi:hypothetical protein
MGAFSSRLYGPHRHRSRHHRTFGDHDGNQTSGNARKLVPSYHHIDRSILDFSPPAAYPVPYVSNLCRACPRWKSALLEPTTFRLPGAWNSNVCWLRCAGIGPRFGLFCKYWVYENLRQSKPAYALISREKSGLDRPAVMIGFADETVGFLVVRYLALLLFSLSCIFNGRRM